MIRIPSKHKKTISNELKKYTQIIQGLIAKPKSSEDDARIVINDILGDVLGFDKYNELVTEQRESNGRLDYIVRVQGSPYAKKKTDYIDFVIEAKAVGQPLSKKYEEQTRTYCLNTNTPFFILTNGKRWELFKVKKGTKNKKPSSEMVHFIDFSTNNDIESLTEDFYVFSKASYLDGSWDKVVEHQKATNVSDIVSILLSSKVTKIVSKTLQDIHDVKVSEDVVRDLIENQVIKGECTELNKKLLKDLNQTKPKKNKGSETQGDFSEESYSDISEAPGHPESSTHEDEEQTETTSSDDQKEVA